MRKSEHDLKTVKEEARFIARTLQYSILWNVTQYLFVYTGYTFYVLENLKKGPCNSEFPKSGISLTLVFPIMVPSLSSLLDYNAMVCFRLNKYFKDQKGPPSLFRELMLKTFRIISSFERFLGMLQKN